MKRKINRFFFHFSKFLIGYLIYLDPRLYMKYYTKLLKFQGLKMKGKPRFIAKSVKFDDFDRISIGDRLIASMYVQFLTHDYSYTTALIANNQTPDTDTAVLKDITVGDNVFIGLNSILMPGTNVGNHVIIGAGSVVRGNIPDYSLLLGNPAKIIGDVREYGEKVSQRTNLSLRIDKK